MTFNDFLPTLGSARGAHRGSNERCFPVLKTLLGPNGPNTYLRAPQASPRLPKITPRLPKASTNHPATSIFFDLLWCSDVPILSQLSCVISVAVMCCLNFVPTHVCSQLSQFCGPIISKYPRAPFLGHGGGVGPQGNWILFGCGFDIGLPHIPTFL